ncbi:MAG: hypothetical protein U0872_01360 [Planctomycetaceae bacterium]
MICDNAAFHKSRAVRGTPPAVGPPDRAHFLPAYGTRRIPSSVWWHLQETITRNHNCQTLEELIGQAYDWFEASHNHYLDMRNTFAKALDAHSGEVECLFSTRNIVSSFIDSMPDSLLYCLTTHIRAAVIIPLPIVITIS